MLYTKFSFIPAWMQMVMIQGGVLMIQGGLLLSLSAFPLVFRPRLSVLSFPLPSFLSFTLR